MVILDLITKIIISIENNKIILFFINVSLKNNENMKQRSSVPSCVPLVASEQSSSATSSGTVREGVGSGDRK